jgi:hypothetical protein
MLWVLLLAAVRAQQAAAAEEYVFQFVDDTLPCTVRNARSWLTKAGMLDVQVVSCNSVLRYCKGKWVVPEEAAAPLDPRESQQKHLSSLRVLSGGEAHLNLYGELATDNAGQLAVIPRSAQLASADEAKSDPLYHRQWGHEAYNVRSAWGNVPGGCHKDTLIVSIDTGADLQHTDLSHVGGSYPCTPLHPMYESGCDYNDSVPSKHGTGVASVLVAGIDDGKGMTGVSDCKFLPMKLSSDGTFGTFEFASAVTYAVNVAKATVITTSIVWSQPTADMVAAVQWAWEKGVPVVAAAGNCNFGACDITYPAAILDTLSVGAVDSDDQVPSWQSTHAPAFGPADVSVDLFAPGVDMLVAFHHDKADGDEYKLESGSSFSAPFVAGLIAYGVRPGKISAIDMTLSAKKHTKGNKRFAPCRMMKVAHNCTDCVQCDAYTEQPLLVVITENTDTNTWLWIMLGLGVVISILATIAHMIKYNAI